MVLIITLMVIATVLMSVSLKHWTIEAVTMDAFFFPEIGRFISLY
jgi:hypothetical protein